jgi:thiol-disulfide isomerase/thioredoxin
LNRIAQMSFLSLGIALLVAIVVLGPEPEGQAIQSDQDLLTPIQLSGAAPEFSLAQSSGKEIALSDLKGRYVLLNFWATWCEPCKDELPHLAVLANAMQDLPVTMVLVTVDQDLKPVNELIQKIEQAAPQSEGRTLWLQTAKLLRGQLENVVLLWDPTEKAARSYGTSKYPETYLVDPRGRLKLKFVGPKPWGRPAALDAFRKFIGRVAAEND